MQTRAVVNKTVRKIIMEEGLTFEKLVQAYIDCRKRKRNTNNALEFEFYLEDNLLKLYDELQSGRYKISKSICFIVLYPKAREVEKLVDEEWLLSLIKQAIYHDCKTSVEIRSARWKFDLLPDYKSLWHTPEGKISCDKDFTKLKVNLK